LERRRRQQVSAQGHPGAVEGGSDGGNTHVKRSCDLRVAQPADFSHQERFALRIREACQRGAEIDAQRLSGSYGAVSGHAAARRSCGKAAMMIQKDVSCDPEQPRALALARFVPTDTPDYADEHVLRQILCDLGAARRCAEVALNGSAVTIEEIGHLDPGRRGHMTT
jgi:hypothetical protein